MMPETKTLEDVCLSLNQIERGMDRLVRTMLCGETATPARAPEKASVPQRSEFERVLLARVGELEQENQHLRNLVTNLSLENLMKF